VTEKIFDPMLARSVPVYLGAPDIEEFVPANCFVNIRDYADFETLWEDISTWPEHQWLKYVRAIDTFLSSNNYARYTDENVALNLFEWLTGRG